MRWFFVSSAAALVVIVAVGFAPSFYLPGVLQPAVSQPAYIVLHGIALTLWYLLFLVQTLLVSSGRVRLHRSLGMFGAALALAVFLLSMLVVVRSVPHFAARGATGTAITIPILGDFAVLILFGILVGAGVWLRRQPQAHKRLMLIGSIGLAAPAIVRWPGAEAYVPLSVVVPQLVLCAALVAHDLATLRRVHPATIWGIAGYFVTLGAGLGLAFSDAGQRLVDALR
jgi:hypothetical protein